MTTAVATFPRRRHLLEEGEKLLMSRDALDYAERLHAFISDTGIEPDRLTVDPVVAIPLPIHARGARFDNVKPEALWHPLFWLPESVALRVSIRETEYSEPRPETDQEWSLRIVDHLDISGVYSAEDGWLDVFALYGIDVDDPADLAAIEAWQAGLPDDRLDAIDLTEHVDFGDVEECFQTAQELYPLVMAAQWGYTGASFLATIEEDPAELRGYVGLAAEMLSAEPSENTDLLGQAEQALQDGAAVEEWAPKVTAALEGIIADYANAIYELERL
jgi:hypothetical protein